MISHRDSVPLGLKQAGGVSPARPAPAPASISRQPAPVFVPTVHVVERMLTPTQVESIRAAMRVFVEDDLARGVSPAARIYCDGCERARPAAGVIQYDRYALCNGCAIEYEAARARGIVGTLGQYVRDKHFGDGDLYALPD